MSAYATVVADRPPVGTRATHRLSNRWVPRATARTGPATAAYPRLPPAPGSTEPGADS